MLQDNRRKQLDDIVLKMSSSGESDANIQFVVDDFKSKYAYEQVQTSQLTPKQGFVSGVKEDFNKRADLTQQAVDSGANPLRKILRVAGQGAGLATDILGRGLSKITPDVIERPIIEAVKSVAETKPVQDVMGRYQEWKSLHPENAKDLESFVNIVSLLPIGAGGKVAKVGAEEVLSTTGKLAGRGASVIEKSLVQESLDEILSIIKPTLTIKEKTKALVADRGLVTNKVLPRKFENITLKPTPKEIEMANVVKDVVSKKNNPIDNISALKETSKELGQKIRTGLEQSDAIWNKNELKSELKKIEKPITVKSDATVNKMADNFTKAILQLADDANKKPIGILDIRQQFDELISVEFPNLYDKDMTPMRQFISKMRVTLNKFAESKLPEGQLADGTLMTQELRKQHLMLDASENIAEKTASAVDSSIIKRAMSALRQNPLVSGVTGGILTYGALVGLFSNPIVIGTLALGGTYQLGKTIITSKILKQSLVSVLRGLERLGKTVDARAIQTMVDQLPE